MRLIRSLSVLILFPSLLFSQKSPQTVDPSGQQKQLEKALQGVDLKKIEIDPETIRQFDNIRRIEDLLRGNERFPSFGRPNPIAIYSSEKSERDLKIREGLKNSSPQLAGTVAKFKTARDLYNPQLPTDQQYLITQSSELPIIHFTFKNNPVQGLAFDRLAVFVEAKPGTVMNDEELAQYLFDTKAAGYAGHDYRIEDIVKFFNQSARQQIKLNSMEERLRLELLSGGFIAEQNGQVTVQRTAAITGVPLYASQADVDHEFNHAVYFTDARYKAAATRLWKGLKEEERDFVKSTIGLQFDYNFDGDEDLLIREFVANYRDPKELVDSYLAPVAQEVMSSRDGEKLSRLKNYYDEKGALTPEAIKKIHELSDKVFSIDQESAIYKNEWNARNPDPAGAFLKNTNSFRLLMSVTPPGSTNTFSPGRSLSSSPQTNGSRESLDFINPPRTNSLSK